MAHLVSKEYFKKVVSFRPKDISDMNIISGTLKSGGVSKNNVIENFTRLYGDEYLLRNDNRKIRFVEMQFKT